MAITTQFSVFLINKPGVLAKVIDAVADAKVNILALTIADAQEHGVLRIVGDDVDHLRQVLTKLNLPTHEAQVFAVELSNRPGALAGLVRQLADSHININYAYVTSGAPGGKTTGILHVDQVSKAEKLLETTNRKSRHKPTVRKSPKVRR
jgi:hypothetical protein